jgi:hypothetical protein
MLKRDGKSAEEVSILSIVSPEAEEDKYIWTRSQAWM